MRIQNKLNSAEINLDFSMLKWTHDTVFILNKRLIQLIIGIGLSFLLTNCTTKNTQADEKSEQGVFELMDSSKTGVLFRNDIVEYDSFNYFITMNFMKGQVLELLMSIMMACRICFLYQIRDLKNYT